jgi:hypothetical protein
MWHLQLFVDCNFTHHTKSSLWMVEGFKDQSFCATMVWVEQAGWFLFLVEKNLGVNSWRFFKIK